MLLVLAAGAAYAWRGQIVAEWPPSARAYALFGLQPQTESVAMTTDTKRRRMDFPSMRTINGHGRRPTSPGLIQECAGHPVFHSQVVDGWAKCFL